MDKRKRKMLVSKCIITYNLLHNKVKDLLDIQSCLLLLLGICLKLRIWNCYFNKSGRGSATITLTIVFEERNSKYIKDSTTISHNMYDYLVTYQLTRKGRWYWLKKVFLH